MNTPPEKKIDPLFAPILPVFLDELTKRRDGLRELLEASSKRQLDDKDWEEMRFLAHKIMGSSAPFGFSELSALGERLENRLRREPSAHAVILEDLRILVSACCIVLDHHTNPLNTAHHQPPHTSHAKNAKPRPLVLVVDDDAVIRGMLHSILEAKVDVATCSLAEDAFRIATDERPDLILLDDQLQGEVSGMALLSKMKKDAFLAPIPVMMITANSRADSVLKALSEGAIDYIIKPLQGKDVMKRVLDFLDKTEASVLIVDDDDAIRTLLDHKFRSTGCRVLLAETGAEALEIMEKAPPSLVILDRMMPGMDGASVLQKMRTIKPLEDIPVIFLTAKHLETEVIEGLNQGASDYIVKPFNPAEVVSRCLRFLKKTDDPKTSPVAPPPPSPPS